MKIPFNDLTRIHEPIRREIDEALKRTIDNNAFILGKEVNDFERNFASYCGQPGENYAAGISNGLNALTLILHALDIGKGDEVIMPANTFNATAAAIRNAGAVPVLVDCEDRTALIDCSQLESRVNANSRAIMPVHLYGQQADMGAIKTFAGRHQLYVVEDAAQAHGSLQNGSEPGKLSNAAGFSMYPGKNLGAFGDAGAVVSRDPSLIERVKRLRNYGQSKKYHHDTVGFNERLDGIQAAILNVKLPYLNEWNKSREVSALGLVERLSDLEELDIPKTAKGNFHTYHLFVIRTQNRDELAKSLNEKGIDTGVHYPVPIHLQPAFDYLGYKKGQFPVAEDWARRGLSLPLFPFMKESELDCIADSVRDFLRK